MNNIISPLSFKQQPWRYNKPLTHLVVAGSLLMTGVLLHRLPAAKSSFKYFSADWKDWAKLALGVNAVSQINQASGWKPPAWLGAIETTAIMNPLVAGFTKKTMLQTLVMSPVIAGLVMAANFLNEHLAKPLKDNYEIPPVFTRLGITLAMMGLGLKAYPPLYRQVVGTGALGKNARKNAAQVLLGTEAAICSRCGGNHLICISEISDYLGSFAHWFKAGKQEVKASGVAFKN